MIFGTVFARRDLARVRVLAESLATHHPDAQFMATVIDAYDRPLSALKEQFILVDPRAVLGGPEAFFRLVLSHSLETVAQTLRPRLARHLLAQDDGPVVMLAPDTWVLSPLSELQDAASWHDLVLLPRNLQPIPDDGRTPSAADVAATGAIDDGIFAASGGAGDALELIAHQISRAVDEDHAGDRRLSRWDAAVGYADTALLRAPGYSLAYWNAHERGLRRSGDEWTVRGEGPLRSLRLTDFDPGTPYLLSTSQGKRPRVLLSEQPALGELCSTYAQKLFEHAHPIFAADRYMFGVLPGGLDVDRHMRRAYRQADASEAAPLNPFQSGDPDGFLRWLAEPADASADPRVSRYLHALWSGRADLRNAFPEPCGKDAESFIGWVLGAAQLQEATPDVLMPAPIDEKAGSVLPSTGELRRGFNLVGYLRAGFGVGEASRLVAAGLEASGLDYAAITANDVSVSHLAEFEHAGESSALFDTNLICVNVDWLERFAESAGPDFFEGRRSVGIWWWEGDSLPAELAKNDRYLDEIWVGSSFVRDTVTRETDLPVHVMPLHVPPPVVDGLPSRSDLGLPDGFMFLFQFDFNSTTARKNPDGLIDAFVQAFEPDQGALLVIKSVHGDEYLNELERLRAKIGDRGDIRFINSYLPARERDGLMQACDCYVSLHRSEGFGLTMAEAMARGKPVIATGYSGNLDFMNDENSFLVPHGLTTLARSAGPYPAGTTWAEPDVDGAARLMREVFENPEEAAERAGRGQSDIREGRTVDALAAFMMARFAEYAAPAQLARNAGTRIGKDREAGAAMPTPAAALEALRFAEHGPSAVALSASRFGRAGRLAKRLTLALTRPGAIVQSEFNRAAATGLVQAVELASARFEQVARSHEALSERVSRGFSSSSSSLDDHSRAQAHLTKELLERVGGLDAKNEALARAHESLVNALTARPYLAYPERLQTTDDSGLPTIGVRGEAVDVGHDLYREFEEMFRGPEMRVRELQAPYVAMLRGRETVLDIGCGRGEMLDLLAEAGIPAVGVDSDPGMIARCRQKGHAVHLTDATEFLLQREQGAFGAVFCAQVIEHIPYGDLLDLFRAARGVLLPGGRFLAETVNPHSLSALKTFWTDLTHQHPIFPEVAVTVARLSGFESAWVYFPGGSGEIERDILDCTSYALVADVSFGAAPSKDDRD
jgi:glycosyltransferase involved in cell wall biosynthesis/SAM-dependent methyltransferase